MVLFARIRNVVIVILSLLVCISSATVRNIYVDSARTSGGNGQSWNAAYNNFDTLTSSVLKGDTIIVRIANGTYILANTLSADGNLFVALGGYPNLTTDTNNRNPDLNKVILSGDLDTNDVKRPDGTYELRGNNLGRLLYLASVKQQIDGITLQCGKQVLVSASSVVLSIGQEIHIKNCNFISNIAIASGSVLEFHGDTVVVDSTEFIDNTGLPYGGNGHLSAFVKVLRINNSKFMNCKSQSMGGAVCVHADSVITKGNMFNGDSSKSFGGGIYVDVKIYRSENDTFKNNKAAECGGGISLEADSFNLKKCEFTSNFAADSGGAVFALTKGTLIKNCYFFKNKSLKKGGGLFSYTESIDIDSSRFVNDTSVFGGALASGGSGVIRNSQFTDNYAMYSGGAFWGGAGPYLNSENNRNIKIVDCILSNNKAKGLGGAIFFDKDTLEILRAFFDSDSASNGGAINFAYNSYSNLKIKDSKFTNNLAGNGGAAIWSDASMPGAIIANTIFDSNRAERLAPVSAFWDGTFVNCLITNNTAGEYNLIIGRQLQPYINVRLKNCTVTNNKIPLSNRLFEYVDTIQNSIIWKNGASDYINKSYTFNSIIENWTGQGIGNTSLNPLFANSGTDPFKLGQLSPAINRGNNSYIDTNVYKTDFSGKRRINNGTVDIGAYEYYDSVVIYPPCLLATIDTFDIPSAGSLTVNCDSVIFGSVGVYVSCSNRPVSSLLWGFSGQPENVQTIFNPLSNDLTVTPSIEYLPGSSFTMLVRVSDPSDTAMYSEKWVTFHIVNPGFNLCAINIHQNDSNKTIVGTVNVKSNIYPMSLVRNRLYLYDSISGSIDRMQYIDNVVLNENYRPLSRGGDSVCGTYTFTVNPTSANVFNYSGAPTGKTLYEWATGPSVTYPGSQYYKKYHKIKFAVKITNGMDRVHEFILNTPVDFSGPLTTMHISNNVHSQTVTWSAYDEQIQQLTLYRIAEGDSTFAADTIQLTPQQITSRTFSSDSLEDSRTYHYVLFAEDSHGNTAESDIRGTTLSGVYTISGKLTGSADPDSLINVRLYRTTTGDTVFLRDTSVYVDEIYSFNNVENGNYSVRVIPYDPQLFTAIPAQQDVAILRGSNTACNFSVISSFVIAQDGIRVEQMPTSGDLQFTVKTNRLFVYEEPAQIELSWESGDSLVDSAKQLFTINSFTETPSVDGSAIWQFIVSAQDIRDSILSSGINSFRKNIQYVNSRIITKQGYISNFREAYWSYPVGNESNALLFAGQSFLKPQVPYVSTPLTSMSSVNLTVRPVNAGNSLRTHIEIQSMSGTVIKSELYESNDISLPDQTNTIVTRKPDWNYLSDIVNSPKGHHFLSGLNTNDTNSIKSTSEFFTGDSLTGNDSSSVSWKIKIPESQTYKVWLYVEDTVKAQTSIYCKVNTSSEQLFVVKLSKGKLPGWYGSDNDLALTAFSNATVTIVSPRTNVQFSTFALKKYTGRNDNGPSSADYRNAASCGQYIPTQECTINNLLPDNQYRLAVYVKDRYGNTSDTIIDTINTTSVFDSSAITVHETAPDGNLLLTLNKGESGTLFADSAIFHVSGQDYPVAVHFPVVANTPTDIVFTRDMLKNLIPLEPFKHRTRYDSLSLVFSAESTYTQVQHFEHAVDNCGLCNHPDGYSCSSTTTTRKRWSWKKFRFERISTTTHNCKYQISTVYHDTIRSARIPVRWPDDSSAIVASQEYRLPNKPQLDSSEITSRTILLSCTNLNRDTSGVVVKEQMAGTLKYTFRPGALCADSTVDSIPFGNRFSMQSGWIAAKPSFTGSIMSKVGTWRDNGSLGARHQWLDKYDSTGYLGGEFYPDVGVSVTDAEISGGSPSVYPAGFPCVSTGIRLNSSEASNNHVLPQEQFHLWVLPSKINTMSNSQFYWGIDGVPIISPVGSAFCNDTSAIGWIAGPAVYIDSGNHTIDLFMKDDGVGIAAIALSKDTADPLITLPLIQQWGSSGFDLAIKASNLPHATEISFKAVAIDRYGNSSAITDKKFKTLTNEGNVPGVVITPSIPLDQGYYMSQYPSFTITTASAVADSLSLVLRLRRFENSVPVDITIPVTTVEKNVWSAAVDSVSPLPEFPINDTILSSRNNYVIYACAVKTAADTGAWAKMQFGVRADSGSAPQTVVIDNPYFSEPDLRYVYKKGMQIGPNTIIGDLEILFESDSSDNQDQQLVAENVVITTDTITDSTGFHHSGIASLDCSSANLSAYESDVFGGSSTKVPLFSFKYGKFTIDVDPDSMAFQTFGSVKNIVSGKSMITDDAGNRGRISSEQISQQPLRMNRWGCTDTFFVTTDYFFLKNVVQSGSIHDGFSVRGCKTEFRRNRIDSVNSTYSIVAAGSCPTCGPFLNYTVLNPKYLDSEFSADEKMKNPLIINYSSANPKYSLQFTVGSADTVLASDLKDISYNGWKLSIGRYEFNNNGIKLLEFGVQLNQEIFPKEKNNPSYINGFSNVMISGNSGLNDSALHLTGTDTITGGDLKLTTSGNYLFKQIPAVSFETIDSGREYQLRFSSGTRLALPTWLASSTYSNSITDSIIDTVSVFTLKQDGIGEFEAHGDFKRTVGKIENYSTRPGLIIDAQNTITYAARDFQIKITPKMNVPIFKLGKGFFDDHDSVNISKGSIGIFSDLSINTLYGKTNFKNDTPQDTSETVFNITPPKYSLIKLPATGVDIINTRSGIQVLLLAPKINLAGLDSSLEKKSGAVIDIYNASFDCDKNLRGLNARFKMPDGVAKLSNLNSEISKIADVELDEIYLGYSANSDGSVDKLKIGVGATLTFGEAFKNIGLDNERLNLDELTVEYDGKGLSLASLQARAFSMPRKIGIGPRNFSKDASSTNTKDYVELISGGNGLKVEYSKSDTIDNRKLTISMNNWSVRLTEDFPVKALRNLSFFVDEFEYQKNYSTNKDSIDKGNITKLKSNVEWIPENGILGFENYNLRKTRISLGWDKVSDTANNKTSLAGYFMVRFDSLDINGKIYGCETGGSSLKIYFDGRCNMTTSIVFKDTIPIVPWKSETPDVFINPGDTGTTVKISFDNTSSSSLLFVMRNVRLQSKDTIAAIKRKLDITVDSLEFGIEDKKPVLKSLAVKAPLNDTLINNSAFQIIAGTMDIGYSEKGHGGETGKVFWIEAGVFVGCTFMTSVKLSCTPKLGAIVKVENKDAQFNFVWDVACGISGKVASFDFDARLIANENMVGLDTGFVKMDVLKDKEIVSQKDLTAKMGVSVKNFYYRKNGNSWDWSKPEIEPTFTMGSGFDILGVRVYGELDFSKLFEPRPGIAINNIGIGLKGKDPTYNTGFSLIINGEEPYVHPEWTKPQKLVIQIPSISLGDNFTLGSALMEFGTSYDSLYGYEAWYFRGMASMSMGVVDPLIVDVAFEKPHPWQNVTGIRHAKVTVKLKNARIPIGTTPFYITGFFGAMYDGLGMPEGATACGIKTLPPGLKIEAAVFIEFERPEIATGRVGFWVHLRSINFGINGQIEALQGVVDADACIALYNSGRAFHGHFIVTAEMGLALQGRFVVDIWGDETGGNFTADAGAKVGLARASLIDKKWLKIPTKTVWFLDMFTNMGKFSNEQNGFTTGVRFFGKTWGLGVVGGSFKIGNLGSYKLKPSPVALNIKTSGLMKTASTSTYLSAPLLAGFDTTRLGLTNLQGGEIISVVAASDTTVGWEGDALKTVYYDNSASRWVTDHDAGHYLSEKYNPDESQADSNYNENLNTISRMWYNKREWKRDSLAILLPKQISGENHYEFMVFASLVPPVSKLYADTFTTAAEKKLVRFSGTVENFQGTTRSIVKDTSVAKNQPDTILKQLMRLNFYYAQADGFDTSNGKKVQLFAYKPIPIEQFEGYTPGDSSLLDNDSISYISGTRTLNVNNLVWDPAKADAGIYCFFSASELLDFATEDGDGNKVILPDTLISKAMVVRGDPTILKQSSNIDTATVKVTRESMPLSKPQGFSATGSPLTSNFEGTDERRTIYLRWKQEYNSSLAGYEITLIPQSDPEAKRVFNVGPVNRFQITIPELDRFYTADSNDAGGDSLDTARMWGNAVKDIAYYKDSIFTAIITPYSFRDTVIYDDRNDTSGFYTSAVRLDTLFRNETKRKIIETAKSDTVDVHLGRNNGSVRNNLKIEFTDSSKVYTSGEIIDVALNETKVINARILVSDTNRSVSDASNYAEMFSVIKGYDNKPLADTMSPRLPSSGVNNLWFDLVSDTVNKVLTFTPSQKNLMCKEMFAFPCSTGTPDCGCTENKCTPGDSNCNPNLSKNDRPQHDPCNGNGDALIRGRSPFGIYNVNVYAMNNGRRGTPAYSIAGPSVYDSLRFRIVPPAPKLHRVSPDFIRESPGFTYNDTLRIRASGLWLESDSFYVKLSWNNGNDSMHLTPSSRREFVINKKDKNASVNSITSAENEILIPMQSLPSGVTNGKKIAIQVVNVENAGVVYATSSNKMYVTYLKNFKELECNAAYGSDSINSSFVMDFIGAYPLNPDLSSIGNDTVTAYFTRLYDFNRAMYSVELKQGTNNFTVSDFWIEDDGLKFILPTQILAGTEVSCIFRYNNPNSNCGNIAWHASVLPQPKPVFAMQTVKNGCYLAVVSGDASGYNMRYTVGINADAWPLGISKNYRVLPIADTIKLAASNQVTFIIDKDGNNRQILTMWIDIGLPVKVTDVNGVILPDNFTIRVGDKLLVKKPGNGISEPFQPVITYTWWFKNGIIHDDDSIVITAKDTCPLTVQTWYHTPDTSGQMVKIKGPVAVYCPIIIKPVDPVAIRIPSSRVLDAVKRSVCNYPLLVRLDTTIVSWSRISNLAFHFTDKNLVPLAHETEYVDSINKKISCWVKVDTINPEVPDNMVYLVTDDTSRISVSALWDRYNAVYHFANDTIVYDSRGRNSVSALGRVITIPGVAGNGYSFTNAVQVPVAQDLNINNTGISLSSWFRLDSLTVIPTGGTPIVSVTNAGGKMVVYLAVMPDLSMMFIAGDDTLRTPRNAVERTTWLNAGASYGWFNTDGKGKIFINGVKAAEGLMNNKRPLEYRQPCDMFIAGNVTTKFAGLLDEVRVSATEIPESWFILDYYTQRRLNDFLKYRKYKSEITRVTDGRCELVANAAPGQRVYTDNVSYFLYDLPSVYRSAVMLKQPSGNMLKNTDSLFAVSVNGTATITVLVDTTCGVPSFLSNWRNTGNIAMIVDSSRGIFTGFAMFERVLDSAATVKFGSYSTQTCRTSSLPYIVLFDMYNRKNSINAVVSSDQPVKVCPAMTSGDFVFFDRETVIDSVPQCIAKGLFVASSNTFKSDSSDSYIRISVEEPSRIHVIADSIAVPQFLQSGWQRDSGTIKSGNRNFVVYSKAVQSGFTSLPGPSKGISGNGLNSAYSVIITKEYSQCLIDKVQPSQYEVVCDGIDMGSIIYTDTNITISALSETLRNKTFIRTLQSDYDRSDSIRLQFTVNRNAWIYCAIDTIQTKLPSFMSEFDSKGVWVYTGYTLRNSDGGSYNVWKKFFRSGPYKFSAVRNGGERANRYNYLFFAEKYSTDTVSQDTTMVFPFTEGSRPYIGITNITVTSLPRELDSLTAKRLDAQKFDCDTTFMRFAYPVRIYLGVAPFIGTDGTFLGAQNWIPTSHKIGFNRLIPDYNVFEKEFVSGESIVIPEIGCFGYNPSAFNHVVLIEKIEYPVKGYRTSELTVNTVGNERRTESSQYKMRNIDIAYSYGLMMTSTSYKMNIVVTGGTRKIDDTTHILSPFIDTVVTAQGTVTAPKGLSKMRTTALTVSPTAMLPDLMPVLVNADSVKVNAIDLSSQGAVRVIFTNKSDIEVKDAFTVVLFEDNDGDYQYNSSIDNFLGRAQIENIAPREYAVYEIPLVRKVSFPKRTMFAFIDADRWVNEIDERNNVGSSRGMCSNYEVPEFTADTKSMAVNNASEKPFLPDFTDTLIGCYLIDNNKDSVIDDRDSLYMVYSWQYHVYCVNAVTGDSLFSAIPVKSVNVKNIVIDDYNGDRVPEIVIGNAVYTNKGVMKTDFSSVSSVKGCGKDACLDFNRDGDKDSVAVTGEFVTILSGRDTSLLYVNPIGKWTGIQGASTVGVVTDIAKGTLNCYDINVSYPRLSKGTGDSAELSIRIGNAGNGLLKRGVLVSVYADTSSGNVSGTMPGNAVLLAETRTGAVKAGQYEDVKVNAIVKSTIKRIWFRADGNNQYMECNEMDNIIGFDLEIMNK